MSEDLSGERNSPPTGRTNDEWIGMLADAEGLSRDEIVERMVASYWTLKEMDGMMEQLEMGGLEGPPEGWTGTPGAGRSTDALDDLSARVTQLEDDHAAVERRVIEEFGHLRTIIHHLMERLGTAGAGGPASGRERRRREEEEEERRLADLKRTASRHGVSRARCDHCDAGVDLALLPTPDCPACRRRFTSLQPSRRWFGLGAAVLTVEDGDGRDGTAVDGE